MKLLKSLLNILLLLIGLSATIFFLNLYFNYSEPQDETLQKLKFKAFIGLNKPIKTRIIFVKNIWGFTPKDTSIVGQCLYFTNFILINKGFWDFYTEEQKEELYFHELIHCECWKFIHNENTFEDKCPTSIFSENMIEWDCWQKHKDYYLENWKNECR